MKVPLFAQTQTKKFENFRPSKSEATQKNSPNKANSTFDIMGSELECVVESGIEELLKQVDQKVNWVVDPEGKTLDLGENWIWIAGNYLWEDKGKQKGKVRK